MAGRMKKNRRILASDLGKSRRKVPKGRKTRKLFLRLTFVVFLAAFFSGVFYLLFLRDFFLIRSIEIQGNRRIGEEEMRSQIKEDQSGRWLGRIPKNNILLPWGYWEKKKFLDKYRVLEKFELKRILPDRIKVIVKEKEPAIIMRALSGNCVFDEEGNLFDTISNFVYLGDDNLPVISQLSGQPFAACPDTLDKEWIGFIREFRHQSWEGLEIGISRFFETPNLASGDLRVASEKGFAIFLDENLGVKKEMEMFQVVLDKKIGRENLERLEYVDLRTDNRVYYKNKTDDVEQKPGEEDNGQASQEESQKNKD